MPDIELEGHTFDAVFGFEGQRYLICSCEERFEGRSIPEVTDLHRQHCERIEEALVAPHRREAARRGLDRARGALAETIARGKHEPQETSA